jgi:hypothetical protein
VALLRFSRDKRGYEHVYLVQPVANRRGRPSEHRILYWYRSPPNVKVGREPFDEETQRLVEAQNPGVEFDWQKIRNTPFPPPQPQEHWRERRLAAKAAKRLQREESDADGATDGDDPRPAEDAAPSEAAADEEMAALVSGDAIVPAGVEDPAAAPAPPPATAAAAGQRRRRRRRRGRRGRTPENAPAGQSIQTETAGISSLEPDERTSGGSSSEEPDVPDGE